MSEPIVIVSSTKLFTAIETGWAADAQTLTSQRKSNKLTSGLTVNGATRDGGRGTAVASKCCGP